MGDAEYNRIKTALDFKNMLDKTEAEQGEGQKELNEKFKTMGP